MTTSLSSSTGDENYQLFIDIWVLDLDKLKSCGTKSNRYGESKLRRICRRFMVIYVFYVDKI
jgi:hypothetical protein